MTTGYVYLIYDERDYKIGLARDPEDRLKQIRTSNPRSKIIFSFKTDSMEYIEDKLHKKYIKLQVGLEWYALSKEDIDWIKQLENPTIASAWIKERQRYETIESFWESLANKLQKELDTYKNIYLKENNPHPIISEVYELKLGQLKLVEEQKIKEWDIFYNYKHIELPSIPKVSNEEYLRNLGMGAIRTQK